MISVIVPIYNAEKYLEECIESILCQSYTDIEIILVNDGSTDSSLTICERYAARDERIRLVNCENGGVSHARNKGLDVARGECITFVDADDMLHPQALALQQRILDHTEADMVAIPFFRSRKCKWPKVTGKARTYTGLRALEHTLYQTAGTNNGVWGKLYRARLFEGVRFVEGLWYEDLEIMVRLMQKMQKVAYITDRLYFYRNHGESFINADNKNSLDVLKVVDLIEQNAYERLRTASGQEFTNGMREYRAARDRKLSANFNMLIFCHRTGRHEQAQKCWETVKQYRLDSLKNRKVRLKNKLGVLCSFLGKRFIYMLAR